MAEKRKYLSPQEFVLQFKSAAQAHLNAAAARSSDAANQLATAKRALQVAHCEDFYSKLDTLLPTHEASRRDAFQLLARLCAGRPNLPADLA